MSPPSDDEDQVFTWSPRELGAPRRSLQEGERHPRMPPPTAGKTRLVMYPGAHTLPTYPCYTEHQHPCHPHGHGCPPAPETHVPPTNAATPAARTAALHPDSPKTEKASALVQNGRPKDETAANAPPRTSPERRPHALGRGKGRRGSGRIHDRHTPVSVTGGPTASAPPIPPAYLPTEHPLCRPATAAGADPREATNATRSPARRQSTTAISLESHRNCPPRRPPKSSRRSRLEPGQHARQDHR